MNQVDLLEMLEQEPTSFGFFQAVRLLDRLVPEREAVGGFGEPNRERVRFRADPSLVFPASEIEKLKGARDKYYRMLVNFMGLVGPLGVLPRNYTLLVSENDRHGDGTLGAFLEIFEHRMLSLFYAAWKKNQFNISYEEKPGDAFTSQLLSLVGIGFPSFQKRFTVPDESLVYFAGLLAPEARSGAGLENVLKDYFGLPITVEQFVGGWYPLPEEEQCRLDSQTLSSRLGRGAAAGDEVWDQQARVRIRIGPVSREQYDDFLPGGSSHAALQDLARFFSYDQFDFELQLVLNRDDVPGFVLGVDRGHDSTLGWCSWVRSAPFTRDADETVLTLRSEGTS